MSSRVEPRNRFRTKTSPAAAKRDTAGRFCAGNRGGAGNPFARQSAALRKAVLAAVTEADVTAIVAKLVEKAREGDVGGARGS